MRVCVSVYLSFCPHVSLLERWPTMLPARYTLIATPAGDQQKHRLRWYTVEKTIHSKLSCSVSITTRRFSELSHSSPSETFNTLPTTTVWWTSAYTTPACLSSSCGRHMQWRIKHAQRGVQCDFVSLISLIIKLIKLCLSSFSLY